jgi:hypothetical protein
MRQPFFNSTIWPDLSCWRAYRVKPWRMYRQDGATGHCSQHYGVRVIDLICQFLYNMTGNAFFARPSNKTSQFRMIIHLKRAVISTRISHVKKSSPWRRAFKSVISIRSVISSRTFIPRRSFHQELSLQDGHAVLSTKALISTRAVISTSGHFYQRFNMVTVI